MKKYLVIILIVLIGGALILIPLLKENKVVELEATPAEFNFEGNVGTFVGKESTIEIKVFENDVEKIDLVFDSRVIKSWNNPSGILNFNFTPDRVGTYIIQVISTRKDGRTFNDDRNFRVLSDITPEKLRPEIVNTYPHDVSSFTEGLAFYKGDLFESTGLNGTSKISKLNLETGEAIVGFTQKLDGTYFGEGITILNDTLYQLTYKKGKCFVYTLNGSLQMIDDYDYIGQEGWGLTNDGTSLIMSDGTARLTFRNPKTFKIEKTIEVYNDRGSMMDINELEYVNGKIYANIWRKNIIIVIDPETGKVLQEIDCTDLEKIGRGNGDVLNGIAYNHENGRMYVTGKYWINLFEVKFVNN